MTYTYHGTQIKHDWVPIAFANGAEDRIIYPGFDQLYRRPWICRILYLLGWWFGKGVL